MIVLSRLSALILQTATQSLRLAAAQLSFISTLTLWLVLGFNSYATAQAASHLPLTREARGDSAARLCWCIVRGALLVEAVQRIKTLQGK